MSDKKTAIIAGAVVIGLGMFLFREQPQPEPQGYLLEKDQAKEVIETMVASEDEDYFESAYMEGCMESEESSRSYCKCTYDYVLNTFGKDELIDFSLRLTDGSYTDNDLTVFTNAVNSCLGKL